MTHKEKRQGAETPCLSLQTYAGFSLSQPSILNPRALVRLN